MKKLRVEVEPLADARWQKIDEAVLGAIDAPRESVRIPKRRSLGRPVVGVVAIAAVAAAAVFVLVRHEHAPVPSPVAAAPGPSHIETGGARSLVDLGFASIDVGPGSVVTTSGDDAHGAVVVLEHGSVECEVAPRAARPPFVVQSGNVRVRVHGTRFVVTRNETGTSVDVKNGVVDVTHEGVETLVHAGEHWPLPPPTPSAAASSEPPPARTTAAPVFSDQQIYEQAARIEKRDPDGARVLYLRLAEKNGPWSANALFAAGRLAVDTGRTADAKRLLGQYLQRYPTGPNAEDARRLSSGLR